MGFTGVKKLERIRRLQRRTIHQAPVSRDMGFTGVKKLERETGCEAPSTKQSVEFIYRLD